MTTPVTRSPAARRDLAEIADFLGQKSARTALRFLDAAEAAFESLAVMPEVGSIYVPATPGLTEVRIWLIQKFARYLVIYRITAQGVEIVRVLHGARDLDSLLTP